MGEVKILNGDYKGIKINEQPLTAELLFKEFGLDTETALTFCKGSNPYKSPEESVKPETRDYIKNGEGLMADLYNISFVNESDFIFDNIKYEEDMERFILNKEKWKTTEDKLSKIYYKYLSIVNGKKNLFSSLLTYLKDYVTEFMNYQEKM